MSAYASVDLPEPFGPMIACTSFGFTARSTPSDDLGSVLERDVQVFDLQECHFVRSL
jgi:hypothetical protein